MELSQDVQTKLERIAKLPVAVRAGAMVLIGVLIGAGYYFLSYQAAREGLETLHAQERELERKLSEVRSVAANMSAFEEEITELEIKLTKVLRQLPNKKELEVLLTDMSNLGKRAGVEIKSFKRNEERVHGFYAEVPIKLSLEGGYHDIARFFDLMAKLPRIVNVSALEMRIEDDKLEGTTLRVSGTATTFRFVGDEKKKAA